MSRDVEYTDTFEATRKNAVEFADSETKGVERVTSVAEDVKSSAVMYRVRQKHGFVYVAVAGGQTVVFGDRGPVGFRRALGPSPRVQGKYE